MTYTINFLRDRQRKLTKQDEMDRKIFKYSLGGFGVVVVVTLIVVGVSFFLSYRLDQTKEQQSQLKRVVLSQEQVEKSYIIFANKIKVLKTLLDQRSDKQAAISYFSTIFGPQVLIREISYEADDRVLKFGLKANSIFVLEEVFKTLDSDEMKQQFSQVNRSELRRANDGSYDVKVTVTLAGEVGEALKTPAPAQAR